MPYTIVYNAADDIVEVTIEGITDEAVIREFAAKVAEVIKEKSCARILTDYRKATVTLSVMDIYDLPAIIAEVMLAAGVHFESTRRALVISAESKIFSFYETVAVNRNHRLKVFNDMEEARKWVCKK